MFQSGEPSIHPNGGSLLRVSKRRIETKLGGANDLKSTKKELIACRGNPEWEKLRWSAGRADLSRTTS
jgi:hypothetical protein